MLQEPWRIELLGRTRLCSGAEVHERFRERKIVSLLAILCLDESHSIPRDRLAELLWPEEAPDVSRNRFRVTLYHVRQLVEPAGVEPGTVLNAGRNHITLRPESIGCDAAEMLAILKSAEKCPLPAERNRLLEQAVSLYHGEFLPGFEDAWAENQRAHLAGLYFAALRELTRALMTPASGERALAYARQAVALEPYDEETHCDLMRVYALMGQFSQALGTYEAMEKLLARDLNSAPSPSAQRLGSLLKERLGHKVRRDEVRVPPADSAGANAAEKRASGSAEAEPLRPSVSPEPAAAPSRQPMSRESSPLPVRLSRFFGRSGAMASLCSLLAPDSAVRLVTLLGPGGVGKTRLALETAKRLQAVYPARVYFVPLADLFSAGQVADALRVALRIAPDPKSDALSQAISALNEAPSLVVLDNMEQLLPDLRELVLSLLEAVETVRLIVTSRRNVGIDGEAELPVAPLALPGENDTAAQLRDCAAAELFLDRARAVRADFALTDRNAADIAWLCRSLEGLPLALELAAARIRVMSVKEMRAQMNGVLDWLVDPRGGKEARHRSLRASFGWSYRLLAPVHRRAMNALSVLAGPFHAEAAAAICGELFQSRMEILEMLDELSSASLIAASEDSEGATRFHMLEALRGFGQEQLARSGLEPETRMRHLEWCLSLAAHCSEASSAAGTSPDMDANYRVALQHGFSEAASSLQQAKAAELAAELQGRWLAGGALTEGREWLRKALTAETRPTVQARVRAAAARLAIPQGDYAEAETLAREGLAIALEAGDRQSQAECLLGLGLAAFRQGSYTLAATHLTEALALFREAVDGEGIRTSLSSLGMVAWYRAEHAEARARFEEALSMCRTVGNERGAADCQLKLGNLGRDQGDLTGGGALISEALSTFRKLDLPADIAVALHDLGLVAIFQRDFPAGRNYLQESLTLFREMGMQSNCATCLHNLGQIFLEDEELAQAEDLTAQSLAIYRRIGDRRGAAASLHNLGAIAGRKGDISKALEQMEEAREIDRSIGNRQGQAQRSIQIALIHLDRGEIAVAAQLLREALEINLAIGLPGELAHTLLCCAALLVRRGAWEVGAQIAAASLALPHGKLKEAYPVEAGRLEDLKKAVAENLGEEAAARCSEEGAAASLESIVQMLQKEL